jgi:hypothetical protein
MTRDDIIRMAEESTPDHMIGGCEFDYAQLEHFANLVAAAEREACAKVCDVLADKHTFEGGYANECAIAIRERGAP